MFYFICFLFQGYVKEYTYKQWPGQNVKLYHLFLAIQNYAKYKYGWKWSNHRDSSSSDMWYKYLMVCDYFQGNIPSLEVEYYQEMFTYLNRNTQSTLSCNPHSCFLMNDGNVQIVILKDGFVLRQKKKCS